MTHDKFLHTLWEVQICENTFGLRMSQDILQKKIDQTCKSCKGAVGIVGDVQIFGHEKTHDKICMRQWSALENQALNLILINMLLRPNDLVCFGNLYIAEEVMPDLKKVEAIKQMQPPINKQWLSSFLGMVTYLSHYMQNLIICQILLT